MPTQILPAASLRSANCLPAARTLSWAANYLICIALWSIARAVFRAASNFLPALRERRALSAPAAADRASGRRRGRATADDAEASGVFGGGRAACGAPPGRDGVRPKARRHLADARFRQPGEHV